MKKLLAGLFASALFLAPALSFADTASSTPPVSLGRFHLPYCILITHPLAYGVSDATTGGEVSALQKFLAQDSTLYPEGVVSGYFGPATQRAIQRLQQDQSIVSSGTAQSTGFGALGPRTRMLLSSWCDRVSPQPGGGIGTTTWPFPIGTSTPPWRPPVSTTTPPIVSAITLRATPISGVAPLSVQVVVEGLKGNAAWLNFGDGSSSANLSSVVGKDIETHTYANAGTYTATIYGPVTMTCGTSQGCVSSTLAVTTASATVRVTDATVPLPIPNPIPPPPPILPLPHATTTPSVTMRANGSPNGASVPAGGSAYVGWSSTGVTSCTISSAPASSLSGTVEISSFGNATGALSQTTTFTVTCTGANGSASGSVTISVVPVPATGSGSGTGTGTGIGKLFPIYTNPVLPSQTLQQRFGQ